MIAANSSWNIFNFRAGLIRRMIREGYEVIAVAPADRYSSRLDDLGCRFISLGVDAGLSPLRDLGLLARLIALLRKHRPDAFLGFTIKLNLYGSIAARTLDIPTLNNISGLGATFVRNNWMTKVVKQLYRVALARAHVIFFQNEDDRNLFVKCKLVANDRTVLLPGSGVNLNVFKPSSRGARTSDVTRFVVIARLLREKGIVEFAEAARIVRRHHSNAIFQIVGYLDKPGRRAIDNAMLSAWVSERTIEYLGGTDDVRPFIEEADCVVLPSYREGTPRALLEAAAMGKPLIATDVPGCRNVVVDGENGFLCKVKDSIDLADKVCNFLNLSPAERIRMGDASLRKVREFDEEIVVREYIRILRDLLKVGGG